MGKQQVASSPYGVQRNTGTWELRNPGFRKLHPGYLLLAAKIRELTFVFTFERNSTHIMADHPIVAPSRHNVIAAWVFGSILLLFYIGVFVFAPAELPDFKHKQLAIFSALLCALFTFFFVGTLKVNLQIKNKWTKLGIQSGGGAAAFVLILWWWNNPNVAPVQIQEGIEKINQGVQETKTIAGKIKQDTE
ncbi:MAG: hypothetical protein ACRESZ_00540 [Methylococcales bacterium]